MDYDNWKLMNGHENEKVLKHCDYCGQAIYEGDEIYKMENFDIIHGDCLNGYVDTKLNPEFDIAREEDF